MALQRAGIDAVMYEAHDRPADFAGSFLNVASNGLDALRAIDVHRHDPGRRLSDAADGDVERYAASASGKSRTA